MVSSSRWKWNEINIRVGKTEVMISQEKRRNAIST